MLPPSFDELANGRRPRAWGAFVADLRDELGQFGLGLALRAMERARELTPFSVERVATDVNNELPTASLSSEVAPHGLEPAPNRVIIA